MYAATNSGVLVSPTCALGTIYDVWYRFVAQTTNPTITLSGIGSTFLNPHMELLSGACGGQTSLFCGTTSIAADYLTPGTTYYIRVYSSSGAAPIVPTTAGFNICITDPVATPPFNDECVNSINLPVGNSCNNVPGTMAGATISATPIAPCTGPVAYDVWYKFTSINTTATITLGGIAANFLNPRIQIFSGACGSLSSIFCGTSPVAATGLTAGAVYYVRVYSTTAPSPNGNAQFTICVTTTNAPLRFGNSYVNLSKKTIGGVVQKGDTLEIRMTVNHTSGTMFALRYVDNVPTKTAMLTGTTDSIRIITNEGLTYKKYTLAAADDAATYRAAPPVGQYNIRLNLGFGGTAPGTPINNTSTESATATGTMIAASDRPKGGGGMLFATAYRVVVTGNPGDTIILNAANFLYKTTAGGTDITLSATPYKILISTPLSLCTNSIGVNNAAEFGGTFGTGTTLNRSTDLAIPIDGYSFVSDVSAYTGVGDGRYAIVKNLSPRSSITRNARKQNTCNTPTILLANDPLSCNNRMFGGFWYVDGDHSGTNNAVGNVPPDTDDPGGYMLMVNADYVASEAYRQTITNLCPNTYYEFSAWIRNICTNCGLDSASLQTFKPGVNPNMTFALDGVDRYNTGEVDTVGWIKKGFMFVTGATQSTATFSIRNNSQGGGGNDWALDDISIATCLPNMSYSPTLNPTVCQGNTFVLRDTIRSFFSNYHYHQWQRSTDGGVTWTDLGVARDSTPVFNAILNVWQYVTTYTIPPANTTAANDGDLYRVLVATTNTNLSNPDCRVTDGISFINLNVDVCGIPLKTELLSFNGKLVNDRSNLDWTTSKEDEPIQFTIERSADGNNFTPIGNINSLNNQASLNNYSFIDPLPVADKQYYRIVLTNPDNKKVYSRTILLSKDASLFRLVNLINPFSNKLEFDITVPANGKIDIQLIDLSGKILKKNSYLVNEGANSLTVPHTDGLPAGLYLLQISNNEDAITRKVVKKN
jgi:trimeric autotransporter adhesin